MELNGAFTDLNEKKYNGFNAILRIMMDDIKDSDAEQLFRFRHDKFKPEALRTLAKSVYISAFVKVVSTSLRGSRS